jgi:outer membrane protein OmpA-like peptidoglycan-associated protein
MRLRLILLAAVAAPLAFGSAAVTISPAGAQAVTMKDIKEARKDAAKRVRQAQKAVKQAEKRLKQAQKKNEGVEEAQAELNAANQELQAAQQQLQAAMSAEPSGGGESQASEEAAAPQKATEEQPAGTADAPRERRKRRTDQAEQREEPVEQKQKEAAEQQPSQPAESSEETSRAAEQQRLDDEERRKRRAERRKRRLEMEAKADSKDEVEVEIKASEAVGTELEEDESRQVERLRRKLREQRRQIRDLEEAQAEQDEQVVRRTRDGRLIVRRDGQLVIRSRDDNERFLRRARDVVVEDLPRGRTRTTITRPNGSEIVTIRDRRGDIVYRFRRTRSGREIVLIDNRNHRRDPGINFEVRLPRLVVPIPRDEYIVDLERADRRQLRETLLAPPVEPVERVYTLEEIRQSERLRDKMRRIDLDTVTFDTGSAEISPSQVNALAEIGFAMEDVLAEDPDAVFLIEGHTDAVGSDEFNLSLSDDRAESVAIVLSENFEIPPENLVTQGYGEAYLKIETLGPERRNRRVTVRPITDLIRPESS